MKKVCVVFIVLIAGCGELAKLPTEPADTPDPTATFTRVQSEIFTPSCGQAGCHDAIGQQQGLVLTPGAAYEMIVRRPSTQMPSLHRVTPGDPANSYLYRKVIGGAISGERMPLGGPPLTTAQLHLLRDWIARGAPND